MPRTVKHGTLVAATKATVLLDVKWPYVLVANRGATGDIYFTTSGVDPTVGGDDCYVVPANTSLAVPNIRETSICEIELISSATPAYSVTGLAQLTTY